MYLYFDKNGVLKEFISDFPVRQANVNVNTIYCYYEDYTTAITSMSAKFKFEDGVESQTYYSSEVEEAEIPFDKKRDLKYFKYFHKYNFFKYVLDTDITHYGSAESSNGINVECALSLQVASEEPYIIGLEKFTFFIANSLITDEDLITHSEYVMLLNAIAKKDIAQINTLPESATDFEVGQILYTRDTGKLYIVKQTGSTKFFETIPKNYSVVEGTNDGTYWLTITIDGNTYEIPQTSSISNDFIDDLEL